MRSKYPGLFIVILTCASCLAPALAAPVSPARVASSPLQWQSSSAHPRLWITPADLPRLRAWATDANPLYAGGLAQLAERAKADMDVDQRVPDQDCGNVGYEEYPTEMYAELFAFLSLVENDAAVRADYAQRARTLLMYVMNLAAQGPAAVESYFCNGSWQYPPFRHPDFFTADRDRARYHGEAFPLVVDWIYPVLTTADKAVIRAVFLRWSQDILQRGYHHPEPVGVISDTALLTDPVQVRFSGNNYYAAHMRNLGLMALALDPADDADNQLRGYLDQASGAYLYIFDYLTRGDSRGGLLPEGFEYSPQTAGYATQFLLALRTAQVTPLPGFSDPAQPYANPFWNDLLTAYLHSLSPRPVTLASAPELGAVYQPAWYGDAQRYRLPDFIDAFAPLGLSDASTGAAARLNAIRWIETYTAPGGAARQVERVRNPDDFRQALLAFMLFDPAVVPSDPRPALALDFLAPGPQRLFSRTGWGADASWFTYALAWNSIDHQMADGNSFSFYRRGEWLTKGRAGYADIAEGIASSEFYNTLGLQNDRPQRDDTDWRIDLWQRGSQWNLVNAGDPRLLAYSANSTLVYALGDATNLYNSTNENVTDIRHASRSILWLKPDHIFIYDRAESATARFKRWWLQLPNPAQVTGNRAVMTTDAGQQLFVTSLLPAGASLIPVNVNEQHITDTVASDEPMRVRLRVDAPGDPVSARFLQVLQGAEAGAAPDAVTLIQSEAGAFAGALARNAVVLFPVNLTPMTGVFTYTVPASVNLHLVTGLQPNAGYTLSTQTVGDNRRVSIQLGGQFVADSGGLLMFGSAAPAVWRVYLPWVAR